MSDNRTICLTIITLHGGLCGPLVLNGPASSNLTSTWLTECISLAAKRSFRSSIYHSREFLLKNWEYIYIYIYIYINQIRSLKVLFWIHSYCVQCRLRFHDMCLDSFVINSAQTVNARPLLRAAQPLLLRWRFYWNVHVFSHRARLSRTTIDVRLTCPGWDNGCTMEGQVMSSN